MILFIGVVILFVGGTSSISVMAYTTPLTLFYWEGDWGHFFFRRRLGAFFSFADDWGNFFFRRRKRDTDLSPLEYSKSHE